MQRKYLKTFFLLTLLFSLISCGQNNKKTQESDIANHHVIITYLTTGNKPKDNGTSEMLEKLNERLNELVNAELEIYYIPWNNYQTNYNLKLSEKARRCRTDPARRYGIGRRKDPGAQERTPGPLQPARQKARLHRGAFLVAHCQRL